jgi:hypothetical protein
MRLYKMFSLFVLAGMVLAACGSAAAPIAPTATSTIAPTIASTAISSPLPTITPTVVPTDVPTVQVTLVSHPPVGGLITKPMATQLANMPDAALMARGALAQQLKVDVDTVVIVSADKVEWPDACLGINTPGIMCSMIITEGYKVILQAAGGTYEYHTDLTGDRVLQATVTKP